MILCIAFAVIAANFEGGSIGPVKQVTETHFRIGVKGESDQQKRNRQATWYYFRVDKATENEIILDMVDLPGEYNYKPNRGAITADTPPLISYDQKTWEHVETFEYDASEPYLRLRIQPAKPTFWIAHTPPYTNGHLERLRREVKQSPDVQEDTIGKSVEGRDLLLWTIGKPAPGRKTIWLMFRQHSWESGSSWVGDGAVRALLTSPLRHRFVWKVFPLCDPDGVASGGVRFNKNGYDLNRNWDARDPLQMPEIASQHAAIAKWLSGGGQVDLFLSLHNTETSEYLQGPPDASVRGLAEKLFANLTKSTTFDPSRPLFYSPVITTEGMKGRMSVVQGLHADFKIPAFLMEQRIAHNPKLGRMPTIEDRLTLGKQLILALAQALD